MKHLLTFLRHDVSATLASTVGSPSFDRRGTMLKHYALMLLFLLGSLNVWGDPVVLFHETFGAGSTSATQTWSHSNGSQTGVDAVMANAGLTSSATNAKQSKQSDPNNYTTGAGASLMGNAGSSSAAVTATYIVGPLVTTNCSDMVVSFAVKYGSVGASYFSNLYYSTNNSEWNQITTSGGPTTANTWGVKTSSGTIPAASTIWFKIEYSLGKKGGNPYIDEFDLSGTYSGSSKPTVSVEPEEVKDVVAEGVTNQTINLTYENVENYETVVSVHPNADGTGTLDPAWLSASVSDADNYATVTYSVDENEGAARTAYIKVYTMDGEKNKAEKIIPVSQVKYVAPFTGSVLEITKDNFLTGGYAKNDAGITVSGFDFAVKDVYQNSSTIQARPSSGYIYNKSVFGEIAKIEITKNGQGNNNFTVYEGTEEHPQTNSVTGEIDGTMTTYTFSSGMTYFTLKNGSTYSTVNPIKIYYNPITSAVTIDNSIENGSVEVSGATDLAQVTVGTELTLSNTPASGYKLSAYDVYKTDEPSTKVTVTNGKFTMPDHDVTVSATFEVAKVLTSIEITTQASQKTFWVGETFNYDGLVVTAHFEGAADEVVTPTSVSKPTMNVAGEQTITVSYEEGTTTKTTNYTIDVKDLPTESNPGSVADMIDIWNKLGDQSDMYVRGTIYQIKGFYSGKYITYWITDSYDAGAEPNHTNAFELYNGLDFGGASFSAKEDLELGQEVVVKGNLTRFGENAPYTYEFGSENIIISRPKVLKSIALSGSQPTEFTQGDEFSSEGLVVTATYNYGNNAIVTPTSITGYDMSAPGNQTVTVSYTESGVTKTATYGISVTAPDNCEHKATISKGEEVNGTFELSVSGELCLDELADNKTSTVLTASPATHYHLSEVTATVGTVGAISDNSCTISEINASTTITAVFAEDAKAILTFARGEADGEEAAPEDIVDYIGETVQLPTNPFTYTGHKFVGWSCDGGTTKLAAGANYVLAEDKAFVAQWDEIPTFNNSGYEWQLVTSDAQLVAGKYYVIASTAKGKVMSNTISSNVAGEIAATFTDGVIAYNAFGSSQSADAAGVAVLQLGGEEDAWTLTEVVANDALLGATAEKKLAWGSGTTTWSISIASANANATIQNGTSSYGRFLHNVNGTRFTTYTSNTNVSMLLPQLYVWAEKVYKLRYDANGGENAPATQAADGEGKATVTDVKPTYTDHIFNGWNTLVGGNGEAKAAGDVIDLSAGDVTLYAQWRTPVNVTVSYDPNGGEGTMAADAYLVEGSQYTIKANEFAREGYNFTGWKAYDANDVELTITNGMLIVPATNVTVKAQWGAWMATEFVLVTDKAQLKDGDKVYIVAAADEYNVAMGTQNTNYRNEVAIQKAGSSIKVMEGAEPVEFTLGKDGDNFTFNDGTGYLYAAGTANSGKNYINTKADYDAACDWTITIDESGTEIKSVENDKTPFMRYNHGSTRFSCYNTASQQAVVLYKKENAEPAYETVRSGLEVNRYYTVCLPKKVTAIKGASFWTLNSKSQDGAIAYLEEETNNLPFAAGKPFIIQATAAQLEVVYEGTATEEAGTNGALHGTLVYMNAAALAAAGSDVYMLFSNELRPVGENNHLDANRAYVRLSELHAVDEAPQSAPGRRVRAMPMQPQVATGFEAAEANEAPRKVLINGELFIIRGEKMYDATGRLVK